MKVEKEILTKIDENKQLARLSLIFCIYSFLIAFVILIAGIVKPWFNSDSFAMLVIPYLITSIVCINTFILGYFGVKAAMEDEDRLLLEKRKEKKALETSEDVLFSASRTLGSFKKYSPYVVSVLSFVIIAVMLAFFWRYWSSRVDLPVPSKPSRIAFIAGLISLVSIFAGIFCVGQSREKNFRWLRPAGSWLLLSFGLGVLATFAILMHQFDNPWIETAIRKAEFIILAVIGIELLFNFIVEFYRPRSSLEERPIFESRLLALLTEPGGILRNLADTLDYQFGFKVSKTWIYSFLENSIAPLVIIWLFAIWVFTSVSEVKPGEVGILENFGRIASTTPLDEGIYFKYPWPIGKITRIPIGKIQEITVGAEMENEKGERKETEVVLWTVAHYGKESRYIVASEKDVEGQEVPVSFISATVTVQYIIRRTEVMAYAYNNKDPRKTLKSVAEMEVSKYLASVDILKLMSYEREKAILELKARIQKKVDAMKLGIEIASVNLHDAHPPVEKVAPAFQDVMGAQEEREASILSAKAYEAKTVIYAVAEASKVVAEAETYRNNTIRLSEAEAMRFKKQIDAYRAMPQMFKLRTYLDFFEKECNDIRKIVVADPEAYNVLIFNFEEKARLDLTEANLGELTKEVKKDDNSGGK